MSLKEIAKHIENNKDRYLATKYENILKEQITGEHLQVLGNILVGDKKCGCGMCGDPTNFIDIISEGYICSEYCYKGFYEMMDSAIPDDKPYSNEDYEDAKEQGLDLDDWNDYKKYYRMEEYADDRQDWWCN